MKNKYLNYTIFIVLSLLLFILEQGEMFAGRLDDEPEFVILNYLIVAVLGITGFVMLFNPEKKPKDNFSKIFVVSTIVIYIITLLWSLFYVLPQRNVYGYSLMPLMMYLYMISFIRNNGNREFVIFFMFILTSLLSLYFFANYYNNISYDITQQYNASYTILFFLPFMLCARSRIIRFMAIGLVLMAIMFSLKRGGLISLAVGLSAYFYINQVSIRGRQLKLLGWILMFVLLIAVAWAIIEINNNYLNDMMFSRIDDIQETGGSGRADLYIYYINEIFNGDVFTFLFGHGWGGTMRANYLHLTAHNDFIEVFYDFGIVGFSFYIMLIFNMIKVCRIFIKDKYEYAPAMGASIGIFFVNSMVSHIWIYYKYLVVFAMFWGFVISSYYMKNLKKVVKI